MLLVMCTSILFTLQSRGQFKNPSMGQTYYHTPVTSSDYLNNTHTKFISNYSSDNCSFSAATGKGVDVVGWTYNETTGGGMIVAGTHPTTPASSPFVGEISIAVPNAVDLRVGYMGTNIVAAYYDLSTNDYMFTWWDWPGPPASTATLMGSFILPITPGSPSTGYERISMDINVDMDEAAIVYSDKGYIYGAAISYLGGASFTPSVTLGTGPYVLSSLVGPSSANINPDVSFNRNSSGADYVYYTYYNSGVGQEAVFSLPYSSFSMSTGSPSFYGAETLPTGVNRVNFDCPDFFAFDHWAYTYTDGKRIYLRADTANGGSPSAYTTIINDGTLTNLPYDISGSAEDNLAPTLAYKHDVARDEIFVVWASTAPGSYASGYGSTYIGATVAVNGALAPQCVAGIDYMLIDNDASSFYVSGLPLIALDRRVMKGNRFVSFGTDNATAGYELKHKNIEYFTDFYRRTNQHNPFVAHSEQLKLYPNPFAQGIHLQIPQSLINDTWSISISDLLGKQINTYSGTAPNTFVQNASQKLSTGQYIIKLQSTTTEPQVVKITKQ